MNDLRAALERALNNQPKETTMQNPPIADLKTTIKQWANEDTQEPDTKTTPNVSRETFNAVRDNPNKTVGELVNMMVAKGLNPSSVSSLLGQMVKQRLVVRTEDGKHHTPYTEYVPLKKSASKPSTKKKKVTITKRAYVKSGKYAVKSGIAALGAHTTPPPTQPKHTPIPPTPVASAPIKPVAFDPEQVLSTLSFPQVLALYKKIKVLLGEAS